MDEIVTGRSGPQTIISLEQDTAETNEPETRIQWKNEILLCIIDAQFSINSLKENTDNDDIKIFIMSFKS